MFSKWAAFCWYTVPSWQGGPNCDKYQTDHFISSLNVSSILHLVGTLGECSSIRLQQIPIKHASYALTLRRTSKLIPPPWSKVGGWMESLRWVFVLSRQREKNLHWVDNLEVFLRNETNSVGYDVIWRQISSFDPPSWIRHLGFLYILKVVRTIAWSNVISLFFCVIQEEKTHKCHIHIQIIPQAGVHVINYKKQRFSNKFKTW